MPPGLKEVLIGPLLFPFYLLPRDADEACRLNEQHNFFVQLIGGHPIHCSIPKENLFNIADQATGTGIWLVDVAKRLGEETTSQGPRHYQGFDISSKQFPVSLQGIKLSIGNVLEPFPEEHLNRYDLVHIRFVIAALRRADYATAACNLMTLLTNKAVKEPGGYLQWDEIGEEIFQSTEELEKQSDSFARIRAPILALHHKFGMCLDAPNLVYDAVKKAGFEKARRFDFNTAPRPELEEPARQWLHRLLSMYIIRSIKVVEPHLDEDEAQAKASSLLCSLEDHYSKGVVPRAEISVIIGEKPA